MLFPLNKVRALNDVRGSRSDELAMLVDIVGGAENVRAILAGTLGVRRAKPVAEVRFRLPISIDYGCTLEAMLNDANNPRGFLRGDFKELAETFPRSGQGRVDTELLVLGFPDYVTRAGVLQAYEAQWFVPARVEHLIAAIVSHYETLRDNARLLYAVGIEVTSSEGERHVPYLSFTHDQRPCLGTGRTQKDEWFGPGAAFAALRAPVAAEAHPLRPKPVAPEVTTPYYRGTSFKRDSGIGPWCEECGSTMGMHGGEYICTSCHRYP